MNQNVDIAIIGGGLSGLSAGGVGKVEVVRSSNIIVKLKE